MPPKLMKVLPFLLLDTAVTTPSTARACPICCAASGSGTTSVSAREVEGRQAAKIRATVIGLRNLSIILVIGFEGPGLEPSNDVGGPVEIVPQSSVLGE